MCKPTHWACYVKRRAKNNFFFSILSVSFCSCYFFARRMVFILFFSFFFSILSSSFSCSVFHLCLFPPRSPCFILLSVFFPLFLNSFCLLLFFSSLSIFPRQMYFIVPSFSFLSLPFQFSSFFHMVCFFFPFFFLLRAYGHPP